LAIQAEEGNLWGWGLLSFKLREFTGHKEYKPVKKITDDCNKLRANSA